MPLIQHFSSVSIIPRCTINVSESRQADHFQLAITSLPGKIQSALAHLVSFIWFTCLKEQPGLPSQRAHPSGHISHFLSQVCQFLQVCQMRRKITNHVVTFCPPLINVTFSDQVARSHLCSHIKHLGVQFGCCFPVKLRLGARCSCEQVLQFPSIFVQR